MSVIQTIYNALKTHEQKSAFCIQNTYYSYKTLRSTIANIQNAIREHTTANELHIGLVANNDLETYAAIIALWFEGKAYVPLNPKAPIARNNSVIKQAGINCVLNSVKTTTYQAKTTIYTKGIETTEKTIEIVKKDDSTLAYIFFTSGTTGTPKGVPITHANLNAFMEAFDALNYPITANDRCLQMFDLTFDLSVVSFVAPLMKGACIYTVGNTTVKYLEVLKVISTYNLTFTLMVPSILHGLRPYFRKIQCPDLKYSMFCGEALDLDITEAWSQCIPNAQIANVYGPTECTIYCTNYTYNKKGFNKTHNGVLCIGKDMKHTKTIIVDANNTPVAHDTPGELCLSGAQLTPGYWHNETINKKAFFYLNENNTNTRYYRTGDLCKKDADGDILYLGRIDFQAKVQGYRIELSEIEFYAKKILQGPNAVALVIKNKLNNTEVAMAIEGATQDTTPFIEALKKYLPDYMIPNKIVFYQNFPLNTNGKIDRKTMTQTFENTYG